MTIFVTNGVPYRLVPEDLFTSIYVAVNRPIFYIYCIIYSIYTIALKMWCLRKLLPIMIGEHVPVGDQKWNLY